MFLRISSKRSERNSHYHHHSNLDRVIKLMLLAKLFLFLKRLYIR